jgi:HK97 family phage prohead protease
MAIEPGAGTRVETKTFPLSGFAVDGEGPGRYGGHVAVFGNVDLGGDLIEPGATLASLPTLIEKGFLAYGHDYIALPIGMIDQAHEDERGLYIAGPFHSHPAAQAARATAAERLAAGKPMGMSIGYDPEEWTYRAIDGARGPGAAGEVRVLTRIAVLEGSLVPLPMNPKAGLTDVKAEWTAAAINNLPDSAFAVILPGGEKDEDGRTTPRSLRKLPHHGPSGAVDLPHLRNALARLPQADLPAEAAARARGHLERHAAAEGVGEAGKVLHDLEHELVGAHLALKEGRQLSAASRARIRALLEVLDGLDGARADLHAWLDATEPPPKSAAARLRFDTARLVARARLI